ncbi:hypothetical protein DF030_08125 [Burkholderia cenocepacia]|nr:hypothetical protein DF030_08125 [Burkholderia cenocepacia]
MARAAPTGAIAVGVARRRPDGQRQFAPAARHTAARATVHGRLAAHRTLAGLRVAHAAPAPSGADQSCRADARHAFTRAFMRAFM